MAPDLKKPYKLDEIEKKPYPVLISLLIGLLLLSVGYNVTVNVRADMKIEKVRAEMEQEQKDRIKMYEGMIFYKREFDKLEASKQQYTDSVVREKTEPFVNKIFQHVK